MLRFPTRFYPQVTLLVNIYTVILLLLPRSRTLSGPEARRLLSTYLNHDQSGAEAALSRCQLTHLQEMGPTTIFSRLPKPDNMV